MLHIAQVPVMTHFLPSVLEKGTFFRRQEGLAMTVLQLLRKARRRIAKPECWCQHTIERYANDGTVAYCALGALKTKDTALQLEAEVLLEASIPRSFRPGEGNVNRSVAQYNDRPTRTHEQVLALYDRAINIAKARKAAR